MSFRMVRGMSERRIRRTPRGVCSLGLHLVWCPKYRRRILGGRVAACCGEVLECRVSSIDFAVEAVGEKSVISRCVGIDDPIVLDARLGILVQLHDVVCPARARRYDLDDEHDIRRRDPGRAPFEHAIWNHDDVRVTHTRRERHARRHLDLGNRLESIRQMIVEQPGEPF